MLIIRVVNDGTGTNESSNYKYDVLINETVIETGEIKGHNRDFGWRDLIRTLITNSSISQKSAGVK